MLSSTTPAGRFGLDPFAEVRRLQSSLNDLFEFAGTAERAAAFPAVSLWAGDTSLVATAEVPGVRREDIHLAIEDDTLTIRGERALPEEAREATWHRRERPSGAFSRTVALPFRVDPDRIEARVVNGVLAVEMHRPQDDLPKRIAIRSS